MRKNYNLTVNNRSVNFTQKVDKETFENALCRGAAKIGFRGGAWINQNFHINHLVTVCRKPTARGKKDTGTARQVYTGVCVEV